MELESLLRQRSDLWRGRGRPYTPGGGIATGFPVLDGLLYDNGWPRDGLTELLSPGRGVEALHLVMPGLVRLGHERPWTVWVNPPHVPYAPSLAAAGVLLDRQLLLFPDDPEEGLWALEQSLASGACSAVLAWPEHVDARQLRRLQLAAEKGRSWGVLFRSMQAASEASPAALRMQVCSLADGGMELRILKRRGGWPTGPVRLDSCHELAGHGSARK